MLILLVSCVRDFETKEMEKHTDPIERISFEDVRDEIKECLIEKAGSKECFLVNKTVTSLEQCKILTDEIDRMACLILLRGELDNADEAAEYLIKLTEDYYSKYPDEYFIAESYCRAKHEEASMENYGNKTTDKCCQGYKTDRDYMKVYACLMR